MEHTIAGAQKVTDGQGRSTGWGVGLKAPGLAQPGSANPNVSGGVGVIAARERRPAAQQHRDQGRPPSSSATCARAAARRRSTPCRSSSSWWWRRATRSSPGPPADRRTSGCGCTPTTRRCSPRPPRHRPATRRPRPPGPPRRARRRPRRPGSTTGNPAALPPKASVENLRGAQDLRAAAIQALTAAGANQGITGKGTGPLNTLLATLSSENLQPSLPGMLDGPLDVPGLHEAALTFGQHADVKVYAKLVNPRLGGLSDGVNLENPRSSVTTTSGEAKHSETGDVSMGWATGSASVAPSHGPEGHRELRHRRRRDPARRRGRRGAVRRRDEQQDQQPQAAGPHRPGRLRRRVPRGRHGRRPDQRGRPAACPARRRCGCRRPEAETVLGRGFDAGAERRADRGQGHRQGVARRGAGGGQRAARRADRDQPRSPPTSPGSRAT